MLSYRRTLGNFLASAVRVGTSGALSYLASDALGSVSEALDGSGAVAAAQLYAPYGGLRYSSGTMPTAKGFTGQRADAATGLDDYGARYYDAVAGQFTSADTVASGRSPYAYVRGNLETLTDPTGHRLCNPGNPDQCAPPPGSGGGGSGKGGGNPKSHTVDCSTVPIPVVAQCGAYADALLHDDQVRDGALKGRFQLAGWLIIIGQLLGIVGDIIDLLNANEGVVAKAMDIYDIVIGVSGILSWIPVATGTKGNPLLTRIVAALNYIGAGLNSALLLVKSIGQLGLWAINNSVKLAQILIGGIPGFLTELAEMEIGSAAARLLSAGGHEMAAIGYQLYASAQEEQNLDISAWCAQHPTAGCVALPPSVVNVSD